MATSAEPKPVSVCVNAETSMTPKTMKYIAVSSDSDSEREAS
jgi:hypothetical protein